MKYGFTTSGIAAFVALFVAIVGAALWQEAGDDVVTTLQPGDEARQVEGLTETREVIREFGSRLSEVSLLSPSAAEQIQTEYGPYVSDELLEQWISNPESAPGRTTSSPWPERIEISNSVTENTDGSLTVSGEIVLMTSMDEASPEDDNAGTQPVEITVSEIDEEWKIVNFMNLPSDDSTANESGDLQAYFVQEIQSDALDRLGVQPIEGLEQSMYMRVYPELTNSDFSGVETIGDTNPSDIMTSADATITETGLQTLFDNIVARLGINIETRADVDALLERLATNRNSVSAPQPPTPSPSPDSSSPEEDNLAEQCEIAGGNWLEVHSECEYVQEGWCSERGGEFEFCESACRHNPEAEVCTLQCVQVCSF